VSVKNERRLLLHSVNRARAAAVDYIDYEVEKPSCAYSIGGPQGVSVKNERRLLLHSVNRARAAAVDNIIDYEVEKSPARTLSEGRGG
jgi:hypothetical protein